MNGPKASPQEKRLDLAVGELVATHGSRAIAASLLRAGGWQEGWALGYWRQPLYETSGLFTLEGALMRQHRFERETGRKASEMAPPTAGSPA